MPVLYLRLTAQPMTDVRIHLLQSEPCLTSSVWLNKHGTVLARVFSVTLHAIAINFLSCSVWTSLHIFPGRPVPTVAYKCVLCRSSINVLVFLERHNWCCSRTIISNYKKPSKAMFRASCCGFIGCVERNIARTVGFLMEHNIIPLALYYKFCSFWAFLLFCVGV